MLTELLPKSHSHHRSLFLLGPILDDFDDWLVAQGYCFFTRQCYVLRCTAIEEYFRRRHLRSLAELTSEKLHTCWQFYRDRPGEISQAVRCLQRFLQARQLLQTAAPSPATAFSVTLDAYREYLREVRGLATTTIEQHYLTSRELLHHCRKQNRAFRISELSRDHIESFVQSVSARFSRGALQHVVCQVRGFLRFLAMRGEAALGLDSQIDTPRVYRLEHLPRALPWETVCAFLESIIRTCASGMRDYAMFMLIARYGLRGCDIAGLKLDDIDWRVGEIRIDQAKTKHLLCLPLTDDVAEALLAYIRGGRPHSSYRQVFLNVHAPILPIKRQSVGYAFRRRVKRSALDIPFLGVHCMRHSYAVHLLKQGVSLKSIGDVLGHRTTESTCVYLRLNVDDLREVPPPLPVSFNQSRSL
jgi:integrase/recombinase XerD